MFLFVTGVAVSLVYVGSSAELRHDLVLIRKKRSPCCVDGSEASQGGGGGGGGGGVYAVSGGVPIEAANWVDESAA